MAKGEEMWKGRGKGSKNEIGKEQNETRHGKSKDCKGNVSSRNRDSSQVVTK